VDYYFAIALLGQMLGGVVMSIGVIVGLRLALPSLARALARELEVARRAGAEDVPDVPPTSRRPVVTLEPRDDLRNGP
jgi:hypothetical protein